MLRALLIVYYAVHFLGVVYLEPKPFQTPVFEEKISGKVVDASGIGVSGALVRLYGAKSTRSENQQPFELSVLAQATTTSTGKFSISVDSRLLYEENLEEVFVIVEKNDFGFACLDKYSFDDSNNVTIKLAEPTILAGRIVNEKDEPISWATVHVLLFRKGFHRKSLVLAAGCTDSLTATTDGNGRFIFNNIPKEDEAAFLVFAKGYLNIDMTTREWELRKIKFEAGQEDIELIMKIGGTITGNVVDKTTGLALEGFDLYLMGRCKDGSTSYVSTVTKENGWYSINCPAGNYSAQLIIQRGSRTPWVAEDVNISVEKGQTVDFDLDVIKLAALKVFIYDQNSQPVKDAYVEIKGGNYDKAFGENTNEDGYASFNLHPGEYEVKPSDETNRDESDSSEIIILKAADTKQIEFQLTTGPSIKGIVIDDSGNALKGVELYLLPGNFFVGVTNDGGRFKFSKELLKESVLLDSDWYEVKPFYIFAQDRQYNLAKFHKFFLHDGGPFKIVLSDTFEISGRVVDKTGRPVTEAVVYPIMYDHQHGISYEFGDEKEVVIDSNGFYRIKLIPFGHRYVVTATAEGFGQAKITVYSKEKEIREALENWESWSKIIPKRTPKPKPVIAEAGTEKIELEDLALSKSSLKISGIVVSAMADPIADVLVSFQGSGQPEFVPLPTDANGRFEFDGLCSGEIELDLSPPDIGNSYPYVFEHSHTKVKVQAGVEDMRIVLAPAEPPSEVPQWNPQNGGFIKVLVIDGMTKDALSDVDVVFQGEEITNEPSIITNKEGFAYIVLPDGKNAVKRIFKYYDIYEKMNLEKQLDIQPGQKHSVTIELNRKPGYAGIVVDEQGKPVNGASLWVFPIDTDDPKFITKADGKFSVTFKEALVERFAERSEPIFLLATHNDRNLTAAIKLEEEYWKELTVVLGYGYSVEGIVSDSEGAPIEGMQVFITVKKRRQYSLRKIKQKIKTDSQGYYEITGIQPGLTEDYYYKINFQKKGYKLKSLMLEPDELVPGEITIKDIFLTEASQK